MAGVVALALLLAQPMLTSRSLPGLGAHGERYWHRWIGATIVLAVFLHVGGLYLSNTGGHCRCASARRPDPICGLRRHRALERGADGDPCCVALEAGHPIQILAASPQCSCRGCRWMQHRSCPPDRGRHGGCFESDPLRAGPYGDGLRIVPCPWDAVSRQAVKLHGLLAHTASPPQAKKGRLAATLFVCSNL